MVFNGSLKVLVVDDHLGIRIGISNLVDAERPRMHTIGSAATGAEALAQAVALQPNVVVLDVNLNGEDGLSLIPSLRRAAPCAVVVLTSLVDPHVATQAHYLGAAACLHKSAPGSELLGSIVDAHRGVAASQTGTPLNAGVVLSRALGSKHP